jgi:hypothetical protein
LWHHFKDIPKGLLLYFVSHVNNTLLIQNLYFSCLHSSSSVLYRKSQTAVMCFKGSYCKTKQIKLLSIKYLLFYFIPNSFVSNLTQYCYCRQSLSYRTFCYKIHCTIKTSKHSNTLVLDRDYILTPNGIQNTCFYNPNPEFLEGGHIVAVSTLNFKRSTRRTKCKFHSRTPSYKRCICSN